MASTFSYAKVSGYVGLLFILSGISGERDSCKMTGKSNYTIYVPLGSSFSVSTTYACTPPEEVGHIVWSVNENVLLATIAFSPNAEPFTLYSDLTNVKVTGNSSVSTLTVHNATMEYNGTLVAYIEKYKSIVTGRSLYPEDFFKVKVIISGTINAMSASILTTKVNQSMIKSGTINSYTMSASIVTTKVNQSILKSGTINTISAPIVTTKVNQSMVKSGTPASLPSTETTPAISKTTREYSHEVSWWKVLLLSCAVVVILFFMLTIGHLLATKSARHQ